MREGRKQREEKKGRVAFGFERSGDSRCQCKPGTISSDAELLMQ